MMSLYCHRVASSVVPIPVCFANSSNGSTCHLCMHGQQCLAPTSVFSAVTICVLLAHGSVATLGGPWLVYPLGLRAVVPCYYRSVFAMLVRWALCGTVHTAT